MAEHRERLVYTLSLEEMLESSEIVFIAVDTPPDLLRRRRPVAGRWRWWPS